MQYKNGRHESGKSSVARRYRREHTLSVANNRFSASIAATLAFLFYVAIIVVPGSSVLKDPDTLWHIRTGEWIFDNGQFPVVDFYSYTSEGRRWISGEWLSEIFFFLAHRFGEWHGVIVLSAIAIAASVGIICFYLLRYL